MLKHWAVSLLVKFNVCWSFLLLLTSEKAKLILADGRAMASKKWLWIDISGIKLICGRTRAIKLISLRSGFYPLLNWLANRKVKKLAFFRRFEVTINVCKNRSGQQILFNLLNNKIKIRRKSSTSFCLVFNWLQFEVQNKLKSFIWIRKNSFTIMICEHFFHVHPNAWQNSTRACWGTRLKVLMQSPNKQRFVRLLQIVFMSPWLLVASCCSMKCFC